jgi:hypothetical protein
MNIHAAVMLLLFQAIWTDRQTWWNWDLPQWSFWESTVHQRQMPTTVLFSSFSNVEILSVIYGDTKRLQTARRHLLDIHNLSFFFVKETHSTMIIPQCYLRLNTKHLSKFNRNKFLTYVLLVFECSNSHNISIYSIFWSSEVHMG